VQFGIKNGRQAAILDLTDQTFCVQLGPMGIAHTKFGNSSLYGYGNFARKIIRLRTTDGRHTPDDGRLNIHTRIVFGFSKQVWYGGLHKKSPSNAFGQKFWYAINIFSVITNEFTL